MRLKKVGQLNLVAKCMKVGRHATNGMPFPFSSGRKSHDTSQKSVSFPTGQLCGIAESFLWWMDVGMTHGGRVSRFHLA